MNLSLHFQGDKDKRIIVLMHAYLGKNESEREIEHSYGNVTAILYVYHLRVIMHLQ